MIKLFRWLFTGDTHMHTYEVYEVIDVYGGYTTHIPAYRRIISRCSVCGKFKKYDTD